MKTTILLAAAALFAGNALAAKDDFNRADLGSKWVQTAPALYIADQALQGDSMAAGYFTRSEGANRASAVIALGSTSVEYGAILIGDIAGGSNIFVKLQSQDGSGNFSHGAFYVGNNGGGSFFALDAPVASPAKVTVLVNGSLATMTIKSALGTQSYTYDYGYAIGTGAGLGTYGSVRLDDFKTKAVVSEVRQQPSVLRQGGADLSR